MIGQRARTAFGAIASAAALTVALVSTGIPTARADDYPSWADVQNARSSQAATQALVDRLGSALSEAQARATAASQAALTAVEAAHQARADADAAQARAQQLGAQAADATARLAQARRTVGALAAARQRSDGGSSPLLSAS